MANWHYKKGGIAHGPIDSIQLKQLAETGQLAPNDLVRRDDMQSWATASKIKGLFPASANGDVKADAMTISTPPIAKSSPAATSAAPSSIWESGPIVGLLTVLIFPVGLYLLWVHPRWTLRTKSLWSLVFAGAVLLGAVVPDGKRSGDESGSTKANTASAASKPQDESSTPTEQPLPLIVVGQPFKGEPRVLSAAHLPAFPNKRRVFDEFWYSGKEGRVIGKGRVEHTCDGTGKVTVVWTPTTDDGITGSRTDIEQLSRTTEYVEFGDRLRIKIGARQNDKWLSRSGDAEYEYVRTEEATAQLSGGKTEKIYTAVIIKRPTRPTPPDENATQEEWKVVEGSGITSYKMMVLDWRSAYYYPAIEQRLKFSVDVQP